MSLSEFFTASRIRVTDVIEIALQQQTSPFVNQTTAIALKRLTAANLYSISNGGKRLRPALVYAVSECLNVLASTEQDTIAAALECIHSYSLVHDDLPAMDNDNLRRGKPTCHIAYDEATALLVGDGLQAFAFELLSRLTIPAETTVKLIAYLAQASGNFGMVGGQAIDLYSVNKQLQLQELAFMHRLKTGALIQASIIMPAIASGADQVLQQALADYAHCIGLAFQIQDDILDVEGNTEILGKTQGTDKKSNKPTYPALLGLEHAKHKAATLIEQAHLALKPLDLPCDRLHQIADFIISRQY